MKLKPCPFCGQIPKIEYYKDESLWSHDTVTWAKILCYNCNIELNECEDEGGVECAKAWNTRADNDMQKAVELLDITTALLHECSAIAGFVDQYTQNYDMQIELNKQFLENKGGEENESNQS